MLIKKFLRKIEITRKVTFRIRKKMKFLGCNIREKGLKNLTISGHIEAKRSRKKKTSSHLLNEFV